MSQHIETGVNFRLMHWDGKSAIWGGGTSAFFVLAYVELLCFFWFCGGKFLSAAPSNTNCIGNGLWRDPSTKHRYREMLTSLVPPRPHKLLLCNWEAWVGICPICTGHLGPHMPKCWDWFLISGVSWVCFTLAVLIYPTVAVETHYLLLPEPWWMHP